MTQKQSISRHRQSECFDVVIVGGGLAGLCAALAAAREGALVALVHNRPVLGGNSSSEIRVPPAGASLHNPFARETGIIHELITEDRARNHLCHDTGNANAVWDMVQYDAVVREKNLVPFFNTHVTDVKMNDGRIVSVFGDQLGSEIRWEIVGKMFIDASGDGVVAMAAGVPFRIGQEASSEYGESMAPPKEWQHSLGSSLHFRAIDTGKPAPFTPPDWAVRYPTEASLNRRHHGHIGSGYWWIEVGFPYNTIDENETLRDVILSHVLGVWDHIKNHCDQKEKAANYALDWVGMVTGKRESRRFIGDTVLTQNDVQARRLFKDRVGYGGWEIDDHTKEGITDTSKKPSFDGVNHRLYFLSPYSVPLSCMTTAKVENLMLAGRILSASRLAFNTLRVMKTLAVLGQAAGTAAASICHTNKPSTQTLTKHITQIQQTLLRHDVYIPHITNQDPDDLARQATVTASSCAPLKVQVDANGLALDKPLAQLIPVGDKGVKHVRAWLTNEHNKPVDVQAALVDAKEIWDLAALPQDFSKAHFVFSTQVPAGHQGWVTWEMPENKPVSRGLYWLMVRPVNAGITWCFSQQMTVGLPAAILTDDRWWFAPQPFEPWRSMAIAVSPDPDFYAAENVVSGVTRPECWSNLWQSDPAQSMPQWIELRWPKPVAISRVEFTFDTNLGTSARYVGTFYQAPTCVCNLRIVDGQDKQLATMSSNYHRQRQLDFPTTLTDRLRIEIQNTNGSPSASIYEVRVY